MKSQINLQSINIMKKVLFILITTLSLVAVSMTHRTCDNNVSMTRRVVDNFNGFGGGLSGGGGASSTWSVD